MSLTIAFVMDPLEGINIETDTTFAFMLAAQQRGHRIVHVLPREIQLTVEPTGTMLQLAGREVTVKPQPDRHYEVVRSGRWAANACDAILIRTDPPFDADYLTTTWLLSFAERDGVWVINSPRGLRAANEKLYAFEFPHLCPETLVSQSRAAIRDFVRTIGGDAIAKPIDGHGGFGVFRLRSDDSNFNALIDVLTSEGARQIVVQKFLAGGLQGDRRLLFLDGQLRGVLTRVPQGGDHRGNVHIGGRTEPAELTAADRELERVMGPRLRQDGLYFAGLDVIEGKLIEVNVTSPTLVQELRQFGQADVAAELIAAIERHALARES